MHILALQPNLMSRSAGYATEQHGKMVRIGRVISSAGPTGSGPRASSRPHRASRSSPSSGSQSQRPRLMLSSVSRPPRSQIAGADFTRRMFGERHRASSESPAWWRICSAKNSASSNRSLKVVAVRRLSGAGGRLGFQLCWARSMSSHGVAREPAAGLIGIDAGANVQRPPSIIYWAGMRRGSETPIRSRRGAVILVDEPAEQVPPANVARVCRDRLPGRYER
jgi:hypothetical protein